MAVSVEQAFGHVLRELREERGLSQEQLGFASHYHRTYISLLERGQKNPSLKTVFNLARALNLSPSEMVRQVEIRLAAGHSTDGDARGEAG